MRYFTKDHEWFDLEGDIASVGITDYAQEQLGKVSYVSLPEQGSAAKVGHEVVVIESAKAASEIYAPLNGEVVATNARLVTDPELLNRAAEGEGWLFRLKVADDVDAGRYLDADGYRAYIAGL